MQRLVCTLLSLGFATLALSAAPVYGTILPFSFAPTPASYTSIETVFTDYGDSVSSTSVVSVPNSTTYTYGEGNGFTPNINLEFSHDPTGGNLGHLTYTDGTWSDPVNYLHTAPGSRHFISFTPDATYGVQLNSFLIDSYSSTSNRVDWNIRDLSTSGTILASGFETAFTGGANKTANLGGLTNFNTTVLEIILTDISNGEIGIDNINFDQVSASVATVPEPSAFLLLSLSALGLMGHIRHRRPRS